MFKSFLDWPSINATSGGARGGRGGRVEYSVVVRLVPGDAQVSMTVKTYSESIYLNPFLRDAACDLCRRQCQIGNADPLLVPETQKPPSPQELQRPDPYSDDVRRASYHMPDKEGGQRRRIHNDGGLPRGVRSIQAHIVQQQGGLEKRRRQGNTRDPPARHCHLQGAWDRAAHGATCWTGVGGQAWSRRRTLREALRPRKG